MHNEMTTYLKQQQEQKQRPHCKDTPEYEIDIWGAFTFDLLGLNFLLFFKNVVFFFFAFRKKHMYFIFIFSLWFLV